MRQACIKYIHWLRPNDKKRTSSDSNTTHLVNMRHTKDLDLEYCRTNVSRQVLSKMHRPEPDMHTYIQTYIPTYNVGIYYM